MYYDAGLYLPLSRRSNANGIGVIHEKTDFRGSAQEVCKCIGRTLPYSALR
jgi:hypothetical protein